MTDENEKKQDDSEDVTKGNGKGNGKDDEEIYIKVIDVDDPYSDSDSVHEITPAEPSSRAEIAELENQLAEMKREKDEIYERLLRKHADFENFRKRSEKDKREYHMYSLSEFMFELLPILDNFERALSLPEDQAGTDYRKGVELIYRQLRDSLEKKGLRVIEASSEPFDPNFHEAISREERDDVPENTILEEFQKGYFFRDKLLRPAMVKVSCLPAGQTVDSGEEKESMDEPRDE